MFTRIKERARRSVAALTAAALLAGTAVLGLAAPAAAVNLTFNPQLTVEPAIGLNPAGQTVTVRGTGYDPSKPMYLTYCEDIPLDEVNFAFINASCTSGAKMLVVGTPSRPSLVEIKDDGTFETTITVKPRVEGQATALYTIADHNAASDRSQDAKASLQFAQVSNPNVTVSVTVPATGTVGQPLNIEVSVVPQIDGVATVVVGTQAVSLAVTQGRATHEYTPTAPGTLNVNGHFVPTDGAYAPTPVPQQSVVITAAEPAPVDFDVTVTGSGFTDLPNASSGDAASGVYVAVVEAGTDITAITAANALKATYLPNVAIRGGAFATKLTVPAAHAGKSLEVVSWSAHGNANAATLIDRKPVTSSNVVALSYVKEEPAPVSRVVTVTGSGFAGLPNSSSGAPALGAYVAVVEAGTDITSITAANAFVSAWVMPAMIVNGAFTSTLTVPAEHANKNLEVVSWSAHGNASAATLIDRKEVTSSNTVALSYKAGETEEPNNPGEPRAVTVTGSDFTELPNASTGKAATGTYIAVVEAGTAVSAITMSSAFAADWIMPQMIVNGAFTSTLKVPAEHAGKNLEVVAWSAHGDATAATVIDRKPVPASNTVALKHTKKEETKPPVTPEVPEAPVAQAGSLQWGVKKSFRDYLKTPLAHGAVTLVGAAQNADGSVYAFPQSSSDFAGATGTVRYSGSVRFTGHDGDLDTTLDKPYVVVTSKTTGELYATVSAKHMTDSSKAVSKKVLKVANLTFGTPVANADGSYTFKTTKVVLAATGVAAFSDFYPAGEVLDNLTFIAGSNSTQGSGATGSTDGFTAAVSDNTVTPGQAVTLTGRGFAPNATGISAYMYSTPVLLAQNLKADAQGVVTTKVTIPANTPAGKHTLSLELGTQKAQVTITVAAANTGGELPTLGGGTDSTDAETPAQEETVTEPVCVARAVSGASLNWGLRSSYVRYVDNLSDGVVSATGSVRRAGASFAWSGGSGKYNVDASKGLVYFGGKLHFAGHDDAMNSTFSNVRIQFASSTTAYVLADVVAKGLDSAGLTKNGAHVATVSLAGNKSASGSKITWSNAPVTLTSTGAAAFGGFYEAGESLDSMTISVPLGATTDCDAGSGTLAATGADSATSTAALAAVAMMFAGLALVVVRRVRGGAATR